MIDAFPIDCTARLRVPRSALSAAPMVRARAQLEGTTETSEVVTEDSMTADQYEQVRKATLATPARM